jgi:NADPH:quinone reductase-like Zn-dependent oxidoreductase
MVATPVQTDAVLAEAARLIDEQKIKPVVSHLLPLQEIRQAHALSESRHTRGKIVVQVLQ